MASDDTNDWHLRALASHRRLVESGDARGALACAADTLERFHRDFGAPPAMDGWIDALDGHLAHAADACDNLDPFLFQAGLAVLSRRPTHPALPLWHARALAFVRTQGGRVDDVTRAANFAFEYAVRAGHFAQAREIVLQARRHGAAASRELRCAWLEAEALEAWLSGEHARARRAVAESLANGGGYSAFEQGTSASLSEGDLAAADTYLDGMARTLDTRRVQDVAHSQFLAGARARLGSDNAGARERLDACLAIDAASVPAYFTTLWLLGSAHVEVARGQHRRARTTLGVVLGRTASHYWAFLRFSVLMSRAWLGIRERRRAEAHADLGAALALADAGGYRNCDPWWDPEAIDDIVRFARGTPHDGATLAALVTRAAGRA
ncbi:MAG: hypothetical protein ACM3JC_09415 [Rudaea sp.]